VAVLVCRIPGILLGAEKKDLPSSKALRPAVFDKAAIITGE
jgi:hypothetical protein